MQNTSQEHDSAPEPNEPDAATMQALQEHDISKRKITAAYVSVPLLMLASVIVGVPIVLFNMFTLTTALIMTIAAELIVIAAALVIAKSGKNWKQALRIQKFRWKPVLFGAGIGVILFIALQLLANLLNAISPGTIESSETSTLLASASGVELYIIMLLVVPFIVPFVEEVFFRGYVFGFLKDSKAPLWSAFLVSTLYFALMHAQGFSTFGDIFIILWTAVIALVNAFLVHKYDSIWPAVAAHVLYNLVTAGVSLLQMV